MSDTCSDEASQFLQMSKYAKSGSIEESNTKTGKIANEGGVSAVAPLDCMRMTKPLQMVQGDDGYVVMQLNVETGEYAFLYSIPYTIVDGKFTELNACGTNPLDSILYCVMFAKGPYIVRLDNSSVEFVARLPWHTYNTAAFAPSGTFFVATKNADFHVVEDLDKQKGYSFADRKSVLDLRSSKRHKPAGFFSSADVVIVNKDLQGNGIEEYIFILYGARLQIAKYDPDKKEFTQSWKVKVRPPRWDNIYGAGWNFQNRVFFASNRGSGVYEIELNSNITNGLKNGFPDDFQLYLKKIGLSAPVGQNDGFNCMNAPSPWITETVPFDCAAFPGPMQAMITDKGYDLAFLNYTTGDYKSIYSIAKNRTDPPFKVLNAFGMGPHDQIIYATLVMDDWDDAIYPTPPPFYVVRIDSERIEFVAKVQAAMGSPIAGGFDGKGTYYVVSNPTLLQFKDIQAMKGYSNHTNPNLTSYTMDDDVVAIKNLTGTHQIADLIAIEGNYDKKGNSTWVLATNAYMEIIAMKPSEGKFYVVGYKDVINKPDRQNFGAAWQFNGEYYVGSNDGLGVFQVPIDKIEVPDGPSLELTKVGESAAIFNNDGLNCVRTTSPFDKKRPYKFVQPFGKWLNKER